VARGWIIPALQAGTMIITTGFAHAGISGRFETLIETHNRQFQNQNRIEERLDLVYDDPTSGLRGGLTLALSQWQNGQKKAAFSQLYLEKTLNDKGSWLSLGRFQRSDAFGFYTLDGVLLKHTVNRATLTFYGGVPGRIEEFRTIKGKALYGMDVQIPIPRFVSYTLDSRFGWQRLEQHRDVDRINIGLRGVHQQTPHLFSPSMFSLTGSYLVNRHVWESVQLSAYKDVEHNTQSARLRIDYETYEPDEDVLTFKDRFYRLYARGRQSQLKTGYQFKQGYHYTWSLSGRRIAREFGGHGYGTMVIMDYHSNQGWQLTAQFDRLLLINEQLNSLYFDLRKSLSSKMRGTLSTVLQQQYKQLTGNNRSAGIEMRLERRIKFKILPSALWFSAQASTIHHSQLNNEFRIAVRLSYSFDDRMQESF